MKGLLIVIVCAASFYRSTTFISTSLVILPIIALALAYLAYFSILYSASPLTADLPTDVLLIYIAPAIPERIKQRLPKGITIYNSEQKKKAYKDLANEFAYIWQDTNKQIRLPKDQFMEIPLIDNWEKVYKAGQIRVYP